MQEIERILSMLQRITMVTSYENIYKCLSEQLRQKYRLEELQQRKSMDYDALLNKLNHATTMKHMLENTMIETTESSVNFLFSPTLFLLWFYVFFSYMSEKQRIAKEVAEQRNRKKDIEKRMEVKNRLLANIGASLKQFDSMCEIVNDETAKAPFKKDRIQLPSGGWLYREKLPDPGEFDARKLIDALLGKVQKLTAAAAPFTKDLSMTNATEALVCYGGLIARNMKFIQFETTITEECKKIVFFKQNS